MTKEQIEAHEEAGAEMHVPTEKRWTHKLVTFSYCAVCGAKIAVSVINPDLWLEA